MKDLENTYQIIKRSYVWFWILSLLLLGWCLCQKAPEGAYSVDFTFRYVMETTSILLACVMIPLALKLFHRFIEKRIQNLNLQDALASYLKWSLVRLLMLLLPVLVGCATHILCRADNNVMSSTGCLVIVVSLIASSFCYPSREGMKADLNLEDEDPKD